MTHVPRSTSHVPVIIGIGTEIGGDDAAGLMVARRLLGLGIEAVEYSGELLGLIDLWEGAAAVILADAMRSGRTPGEIAVLDARDALFSGEDFIPVSTHGIGVYETLALASELGRLPARVIIYGIEGRNFEPGSEPSAEVLEAVEEVARRIAREVTECTSPV